MKLSTLVLATTNPGKIKEFNQLLSPLHCVAPPIGTVETIEETGVTFIENALLKARASSGCSPYPCLADDSGLVVPALNGAPGIYSARYAQQNGDKRDNLSYLLHRLATVPNTSRHAYFYCAMAFVQHADDPTPLVVTGKLAGLITKQPVGSHGFGYDPVFYLPQYECTLAELSPDIKNTISHRAEALKQLREHFEPIP